MDEFFLGGLSVVEVDVRNADAVEEAAVVLQDALDGVGPVATGALHDLREAAWVSGVEWCGMDC